MPNGTLVILLIYDLVYEVIMPKDVWERYMFMLCAYLKTDGVESLEKDKD